MKYQFNSSNVNNFIIRLDCTGNKWNSTAQEYSCEIKNSTLDSVKENIVDTIVSILLNATSCDQGMKLFSFNYLYIFCIVLMS